MNADMKLNNKKLLKKGAKFLKLVLASSPYIDIKLASKQIIGVYFCIFLHILRFAPNFERSCCNNYRKKTDQKLKKVCRSGNNIVTTSVHKLMNRSVIKLLYQRVKQFQPPVFG